MRVMTTAKEIRSALQDLKPLSVAVAYVGAGWKKYVSTKHLQEIVLSPTLGSNPRAIDEIVETLGDDNVYFLDHLHSKIYLGADAALLGSCNLSDGGIADHGRLEAAIVLVDEEARKQLTAQFERYKEAARELYPTKKKKLARLRKLKEQCDRAQWFGLADVSTKSPSIRQYSSNLDRIHIVWCGSEIDPYNESVIEKAIHEVEEIGPDDYFKYALQFHRSDDIRPGDWVLCWRCKDDGMPWKNGDVSWFYAHHVVLDGFDTDDYPKLAGEAKAKFLKRPAPPFALDPPTKALVRKILGSGQFPELLSLDDSIWQLGPADAVTPAFLIALKKASGIKA